MKKTSVPEQALFFYIRKFIDHDAKNNCVWIGKYCADITFNVDSVCYNLEYDSYSQHVNRASQDIARNRCFIQNGVRVIRMRDKGLPFIDDCTCIRFDFQDYRPQSLQKANEGVNELLRLFGVTEYVDIAHDIKEIRAMYNQYT